MNEADRRLIELVYEELCFQFVDWLYTTERWELLDEWIEATDKELESEKWVEVAWEYIEDEGLQETLVNYKAQRGES